MSLFYNSLQPRYQPLIEYWDPTVMLHKKKIISGDKFWNLKLCLYIYFYWLYTEATKKYQSFIWTKTELKQPPTNDTLSLYVNIYQGREEHLWLPSMLGQKVKGAIVHHEPLSSPIRTLPNPTVTFVYV